ncbi:cytochrome P450 4C1-like [Centruroides sculpturatus]|uniref:cytochrome P450 4C1-like n=1 Tax=Centruroides sculpturatus TaxID=218467 RepID=UPI000C6CC065|nr:cytochrome P450 4C1-like [Centruroides sculpturatus]
MGNILQNAFYSGMAYTIIGLLCFILLIYVTLRIYNWIKDSKCFGDCNHLHTYLKFLLKLRTKKIGLDCFIDETFLYRRCKGYISINLIFTKWILVFRPEYIKMLLDDDENINRPLMKYAQKGLAADSLLFRNGEKWRIRKKLLAPTFNQKTLDKFQSVIDENAKRFVDELKESCGKEWTPVFPIIRKHVFSILLGTIIGISRKSKYFGMYSTFMELDEVMGSSLVRRIFNVFLWSNTIFSLTKYGRKYNKCKRTARELVKDIVMERLQELNTQDLDENDRLSCTDLLLLSLNKNPDVTMKNVIDDIVVFLVAGYHTFSITLAWAIYELGRYPNIQRKIQNELDEIFRDDPNRSTTKEDLSKMAYLQLFIKEILRKYPALPVTMRSSEKMLRFGEEMIPKNSIYFIDIFHMQRNPEIYTNPEVIDPDRFLEENSKRRHPYSFVPFSAGIRKCIGKDFNF